MNHEDNTNTHSALSSSDPSLSRTEFLKRAVKGSVLVGGAMSAPKILDKFLVPPAYAASSACAFFNDGDLTPSLTGSTKSADAGGDIYILNGPTGAGTDVNEVTCNVTVGTPGDTDPNNQQTCIAANLLTTSFGSDVSCPSQ